MATLIKTINSPTSTPKEITSLGQYLYVLDTTPSIGVIDKDGVVVRTISLSAFSGTPFGMDTDGKHIYIALFTVSTAVPTFIAKLNLNGDLVRLITGPVYTAGTNPRGFAYDGRYFYLGSEFFGRNFIDKVDITGKSIRRIQMSTPGPFSSSKSRMTFYGRNFTTIGPVSLGAFPFFSLDKDGKIINTQFLTVSGAAMIDLTFDGRYFWVVDDGNNDILMVDLSGK